jgi:hypothetical protein
MLLVKSSIPNFNRETKTMFDGKLLFGTKIIVGNSNILQQKYCPNIYEAKVIYIYIYIYIHEKKT